MAFGLAVVACLVLLTLRDETRSHTALVPRSMSFSASGSWAGPEALIAGVSGVAFRGGLTPDSTAQSLTVVDRNRRDSMTRKDPGFSPPGSRMSPGVSQLVANFFIRIST